VQPIPTATEAVASPQRSGDLVRRSREGDAEAFAALYREHVGRVYALCLRLSGDTQAANELTQDVFVKAWQGLGGFRGDSAFGTWLHALACNAVRQSQRSEARRRSRVEVTDDVERLSAAAPDASPEARIDLERAIASLPPRARRALVLHDIHGYRCREVAELTGTAVGTIQAHLHRARKLLREVLAT
jgi:RNA polymerase sigma-70 factor, ECF subfamily